jgi:hypothetical protein
MPSGTTLAVAECGGHLAPIVAIDQRMTEILLYPANCVCTTRQSS